MSVDNMQTMMKLGQVKFKPSFKLWNYAHTAIVVVGCGGTGGRIIPILAQHIANHNADVQYMRNVEGTYFKHKLELVLVDMDEVEAKNLKRQNFYSFDIGKNKAQCLAERFSALYAIDIKYSCDPIDKAVNSGLTSDMSNVIAFDCTDNVNARRDIEKHYKREVIISCGNEDTFGQVLVSGGAHGRQASMFNDMTNIIRKINTVRAGTNDNTGVVENIQYLPSLLTLYPNFKDTTAPSCTEIVLQNDQSMPINMLVAQLAYNAFYDIISGVGLKYNLVKCNIDNTYTTSFINSPVNYRNLLMTAFCGNSSEDAVSQFSEFNSQRNQIIRNIDYIDPTDLVRHVQEIQGSELIKVGFLTTALHRSQENWTSETWKCVVDYRDEMLGLKEAA